jgi:hypothetical protein
MCSEPHIPRQRGSCLTFNVGQNKTIMASNGDLTRSVETGAYKKESDERLLELIEGSLDIHGSNPIALHRITHAADILKKELASREAARRELADANRHREIEARLNELKTPHWTVKPNFWITVIAAVAAILGAYFAWLSLPRAAPAPQPIPVLSSPSSPPMPQP